MTPPSDIAQLRRAIWIAHLRSDEYVQGHGALRVRNTFCCMGVVEHARNATRWREVDLTELRDHGGTHDLPDVSVAIGEFRQGAELTHATADWLGLATSLPYVVVHTDRSGGVFEDVDRFNPWDAFTLAELNDDQQFTFPMIASVLEDQPINWNGTHDFAMLECRRRNRDRTPRRRY